MFFRQRLAKEASLSYFFGCGSKGRGVAVDVVEGDESWFLEQADKEGVHIDYVVDTHVHADHVSGGRTLAERAGAPYALHESAAGIVRYTFHPLRDGDLLDAGNVRIRIIHTPGHTPDSLCLLVTDLRRGAEPWFLLTGDTLFVGAVGRPDLGGSSEKMAGILFETLKEKILVFPDEMEIYPGHISGSVCAAGISGKPSSTIGFEKRFNPMLRISDRESFVRSLLRDIPERPAEMESIVRRNTA
ncbi:MAG: MBL fold metallo-hydrolase [Nitrospirota bacterium]|nr:MBL fold metallo-hydrolase [Nitrospirota bacterium]